MRFHILTPGYKELRRQFLDVLVAGNYIGQPLEVDKAEFRYMCTVVRLCRVRRMEVLHASAAQWPA